MSKIALVLAIYAAGAATFLLVTAPAKETAEVSSAVEAEDAAARTEHVRAIMSDIREMLRREDRSLLREIDTRLSRVEHLRKTLDQGLADAQKQAESAARYNFGKLEVLEEEVKRYEGLTKRASALSKNLKALAKRVEAVEKRPAVIREIVKSGPAPAKPAKPAEPSGPKLPKIPVDPPPDPNVLKARLDKAMAELESKELAVVFKAIETVRRQKALQATPRLLKILAHFPDAFARMAAAAALGDMRACDAVPGLTDALLDKSSAVAQQANKSIRQITDYDTGLSATARIKERRSARSKLREWWRRHEAEVRERHGQAKEAPARDK